jgi:hypothetical protein
MIETVIKIMLTSVLVVGIAAATKRNVFLGALLASLPLTSVLAMIWLYWDTGDTAKVAGLATGIFWLVLPSLILFLALPVLLHAGYGFFFSLLSACGLTVAGYFAMVAILAKFGIAV